MAEEQKPLLERLEETAHDLDVQDDGWAADILREGVARIRELEADHEAIRRMIDEHRARLVAEKHFPGFRG